MELIQLGWNKTLEKSFKMYRTQGCEPARVFSEKKKTYSLYTADGEIDAAARGIMWHKNTDKHDRPAVGDWVALETGKEEGNKIIRAILPRKGVFSRKSTGSRKRLKTAAAEEQVIAANVDVALIVIGMDRDFNLRRIERYLALVQGSGASPVIILNKTDLCPDLGSRLKEVTAVVNDVPVIPMMARDNKQAETVYQFIGPGTTIAMLGSSGVGKSTIINQLLGYGRQEVKEISDRMGKGQHTTSRRELIILPGGGLIMDNPGMREVQPWTDEDTLTASFPDIEALAMKCQFTNCQHETEPHCAVKLAVETDALDRDRLENYRRMRGETQNLTQQRKESSWKK
ncbi:MAG: ribosome small subunit-dependent GTPase A [Calditrichales bacterium]|nr:MAG: ribosome small subunit-dependent GTPase A [Calditrichales bacterium]